MIVPLKNGTTSFPNKFNVTEVIVKELIVKEAERIKDRIIIHEIINMKGFNVKKLKDEKIIFNKIF